MTVARLAIAMTLVFVGLVTFQNCAQTKAPMAAFNPGTAVSSTTGVLDGTYTVSSWTCNQKDILQTLGYAGATNLQIVISGASATQKMSFGTTCTSSEILPLTYNGVTNVTLTQAAVTCAAACTTSQCRAVAAPSTAASINFSYTKSADAKTITFSRTLTSIDVTNTGWAYGSSGCGVGNLVTLILSK